MTRKNFYITILILFLSGVSSPLFSQSPYKLNWTKESIIFGTGLGISALSLPLNDDIVPLTINQINELDRNNINGFDRRATFNYSTTEGKYSDILLAASIITPALFAFSNKVTNDFVPVLTMYFETLMLSAVVPYVTKGITQRVRPFAYNENASIEDKLTKNAKRSFFSGHTTISFAMAVFVSTVYSDYYPNSDWKPVVWAGSLALATTVGVLRYSSGSHFPTDIITGAVVGSAIGYFIPFIHRKKSNNPDVSFGINGNGSVMNIHYKF